MRWITALAVVIAAYSLSWAQSNIPYYLPNISYDPKIPTPASVLGYEVGEWHVSHDQQYMYMKMLADASDRITITEYARTHERRPMVYLTITSPKNHGNLESLKARHKQLTDPQSSAKVDLANTPLVVYQGFSIHGNEPSGGNAALLVAYYLAAGQSPEIEQLLDQTIILLDPCFNPDGFQRFSTWANMNRNKNITADPQHREYREPWPMGRTNHYWFDLNRDWLPAQHPESQGRLRTFHEWKPNILTDHHEMGTNATFFFMPGEPQRVHPLTPARNQELTARIADFHVEALDKIGSLYYTREGFDDFYFGKGSTYPDINGAVGILFEQASSRGHVQETENGLLTFAFTIRNQVTTALSTQKAAVALKNDLLQMQRDFYQSALKEAQLDNNKAYVFGDAADPARAAFLIEILNRHQVDVYRLNKQIDAFSPATSYVVPLEQPQYRLIRAAFETMTSFQDSLFYDISSWTLPLAFNMPYQSLDRRVWNAQLLGEKVTAADARRKVAEPAPGAYAYVLEWNDYNAPKALNFLLNQGLRAKVSTAPFKTPQRSYDRGAVMIPVANQSKTPAELYELVKKVTNITGTPIYAEATGYTPEGSDMGSSTLRPLKAPKVLLLTGEGVSAYDAGEVWHLFDQRYDMEISLADAANLAALNLDRYTVVIMPDGGYSSASQAGADQLRRWVQGGGVLIAMQGAISWAKDKGLVGVELRKEKEDAKKGGRRPYEKQPDDSGAQVIGGAIVAATADLTHPLLFGYHRAQLPLFRQGTLMMEPAKNAYATPLVYTDKPLLSGYISSKNLQQLSQSAAAVVGSIGRGRVICLADNPAFRAFWFGGNKLLANAVFFGHTINGAATEPAGK